MWFNRIAVAEPAVKITRAWGCFCAPVESSCGFDHNIFSSHLIMECGPFSTFDYNMWIN